MKATNVPRILIVSLVLTACPFAWSFAPLTRPFAITRTSIRLQAGTWSGGAYDPNEAAAALSQDPTAGAATAATASTTPNSSMEEDNKTSKTAELKQRLLHCASLINRGFDATAADRQRIQNMIYELADLNPTQHPAQAYYKDASDGDSKNVGLAGSWTLVYTDAPDITLLENNVFATLGRIGQECDPPYITNVIEWKRPTWAAQLPCVGRKNNDEVPPRVLQKVVLKATASPERPTMVDLEVAGLRVEADKTNNTLAQTIEQDGLVAALLQAKPINLQGPLTLPFGQFEILYLDQDLRIVKTGQGYFAVNTRVALGQEWF